MKFKFITIFSIFLLFSFTGCDNKNNNENNETSNKQTKKEEFPKFTLKTDFDQTINLQATENGIVFKGYEGKVILLDFFATWCPPCKAEIPHLNDLREKYKGKLEIISILLEEDKSKEDVQDFIKQFDIKYPISNTPENFVLAQAVGGVQSIPTMFLFAPDGEVFEKYVGMVPEEMLSSDIDKALAKKID